jgi:hypothetical protein
LDYYDSGRLITRSDIDKRLCTKFRNVYIKVRVCLLIACFKSQTRGSQTVGRAPRGGGSCPSGGPVVSVRDIYFEQNMGSRQNIYFGRHFAWLKYFTYRLVPVLAPNYKQHILSPTEVRIVCY